MLSTHLMGDVERSADHIIVLEGGRVAQQGELSQFTRETETLLLEVDDRREEVATALAARGVEATDQRGVFVIEQAGDKEYDAVRDAVAETGARLRRLSPLRHSLTDIFRDETT